MYNLMKRDTNITTTIIYILKHIHLARQYTLTEYLSLYK